MPDSARLFFEDLQVGRVWESPARAVTESDRADFAALAGLTPPGLLGLSLAGGLFANNPPVRVQAFVALGAWEFLAPVEAGDAIRVRSTVLARQARGLGRRGVVRFEAEVVTRTGAVAQRGLIDVLVEARGGAAAGRRDGRGGRKAAASADAGEVALSQLAAIGPPG